VIVLVNLEYVNASDRRDDARKAVYLLHIWSCSRKAVTEIGCVWLRL